MKIIRNGQEFELTYEEMVDVAKELAKIQSIQIEELGKERDRLVALCYQMGEGLSYPGNILAMYVLPNMGRNEDIKKFLYGSEETRQDMIEGMLWAISTLPDKHIRSLEYKYREGIGPREASRRLGINGTEYNKLIENAFTKLNAISRRAACLMGFSEFRNCFAAMDKNEQNRRLQIRVRASETLEESECVPTVWFGKLHNAGISIESAYLLLKNNMVYIPSVQKYIDSGKDLFDIPGMTEAIQEDILEAVAYYVDHTRMIGSDDEYRSRMLRKKQSIWIRLY